MYPEVVHAWDMADRLRDRRAELPPTPPLPLSKPTRVRLELARTAFAGAGCALQVLIVLRVFDLI